MNLNGEVWGLFIFKSWYQRVCIQPIFVHRFSAIAMALFILWSYPTFSWLEHCGILANSQVQSTPVGLHSIHLTHKVRLYESMWYKEQVWHRQVLWSEHARVHVCELTYVRTCIKAHSHSPSLIEPLHCCILSANGSFIGGRKSCKLMPLLYSLGSLHAL